MKKFISCVVFVALALYLVSVATEILTPKFENRYYILEKYLEENPEDNLHDVQVFGSCHAYTSFNPVYMEELSGVSGFVYANAGEIMPITYARMVDQFKKHTPKVALVEIWGMNPYETYSAQKNVFGYYLANNLERTGFSLAKQEVIWDFQDKEYEDINFLTMNFPVVSYKDRLLDGSLTDVDYAYSFEDIKPLAATATYYEMYSRLKNNGYRATSPYPVTDYPEKQNTVESSETVEIEPDIAEYIQKIIDLCKGKNVELIFYRSPYTSTEDELRKLNHLRQICDGSDVLFVDLEAKIQYDYKTDFLDYWHLSEIGANKSTEFLMPYIMEALGETWEKKDIQRKNLLTNSDFLNADNAANGNAFDSWQTNSALNTVTVTEKGIRTDITGSEEGWQFYQVVAGVDDLWGESITAYFSIVDYAGEFVAPIISFRNAEDKEIGTAKAEMTSGKCTVTGAVPVGTESVRIGFYAWEGSSGDDFFVVDQIELYRGAFTAESLPAVINE